MGKKIKVGLIGIGNCFSGLIQGIEYYTQNPSQEVICIMHNKIGDFSIHDLDFVVGFDVGDNKIGKTINEAIYESPNMVNWVPKDKMPKTSAKVYQSPILDGVGIWVENKVNPIKSNKTDAQLAVEIKKIIKETGAEILVSYLPVGSEKVTQFWAQICLDTNCAFVNCIPFLGNTKLMFMRIEGKQWANIPYNMEVRLEVDDKANSAGIVIDAIRLAKIALDRGIGGPIIPASAYLMKHPLEQMSDVQAKVDCEKFVDGK